MVEPFATVVLNTLLSSRSTLRNPTVLTSAARVMGATSRVSTSPGFFTPQPRPVQGRRKETDGTSCRLDECREWSSCVQRHSLWCPHQSRFVMFRELGNDHQNTSPRRFKSRQSTNSAKRCRATQHSGNSGEQRRHASEFAEARIIQHDVPTASSSTYVADHSTRLRQLGALATLPEAELDLEEGWRIFASASYSSIPTPLSLAVMERLVDAAEGLYQGDGDPSIWGRRIGDVLTRLGPETTNLADLEGKRLRLMGRAMALEGNIGEALSFARAANETSPSGGSELDTIQHYRRIISSILNYQDEVAVLDFIAAEWHTLGPLLAHPPEQARSPTNSFRKSLRTLAFTAVAEIQNPASILAEHTECSDEQYASVGKFLIEALCFFHIPTDALDVYHEMKRQGFHVPANLQLSLVRSLTSEEHFGPAQQLYESIPKHESHKYYLSTGLHLHSHQGNIQEAESFYQQLEARNWIFPNDITMIISVYTRQNKPHHRKHGHALFNKHFPQGPDGRRTNSPRANDYNAIMLAHKAEGDVDGASYWLEDISKSGLNPNIYIYTTILGTLAVTDDLPGIQVIMDHMRSSGIQPNAAAYTVLITLLAHRKDVVTAETVFRQALQEGVVPDRKMLTSMMNAHVEAGSWKGVIHIFDYIRSFPFRRRVRLTIEVYNTLLKAYVLSGSPFWVVSKIVRRLENSHIRPDSRTFSLLIQSACDAGRMDIASDLFWEMDQLAENQKERRLEVTVYALTILMAGFLRQGDKTKAKSVYDEMTVRGIEPTAVSYGAILKAYVNEGTQSSIQVAENFIKQLVGVPREEQVWNTPAHGRKAALRHLYGPLLAVYSRQGNTEEVERVFQEMVNAGGSPSLGTLATILDGYRRKFDVDAVLEIWPQIFRLALAQRDALPESMKAHNHPHFRGSILAAPFSIYMDALSAAGLHARLTMTWQELVRCGFTFDSHNWNHLAVAFVRAGQVERAFELVDKVLLANEQKSQYYVLERDINPSSPLVFDPTSGDLTPQNTAKREAERRSQASKAAEKEMPAYDIYGNDGERQHDFAHPLHILHQISPAWANWQPHKAVLTVLLMVLIRLESGALVTPVRPDDEPNAHLENESFQARQMLNRIYESNPNVIKAVHKHEIKERLRLGADYDSTYNMT